MYTALNHHIIIYTPHPNLHQLNRDRGKLAPLRHPPFPSDLQRYSLHTVSRLSLILPAHLVPQLRSLCAAARRQQARGAQIADKRAATDWALLQA